MKKKSSKSNKKRAVLISLAVAIGAIAIIAAIIISTVSINKPMTSGNVVTDDTSSENTDDNDDDGEADLSVLVALDSDDVIGLIENESTGFLYVGRPTCSHCQAFAPILTKVVKEHNYVVYYYDTDAANSDSDKKSEALTIIEVTGVPSFLYIENGVVLARLSDRTSESALINFIQTKSN